ncbi:hypothetical protein ACFLVN_02605 [Chloroflexota bacterium]
MPTVMRIGLVLMLLGGSLSFAAPASADTIGWSEEPIPGTLGNVIGPVGVDVRDMAVASDGRTIYVAPGDRVADNVVYRSANIGESWTTWSVDTRTDLVAVASDDNGVVAIANSSTLEVYLTIDGSSTWTSLGTPQESGGGAATAIYDIAVSAESEEVRYVAVAGKEEGDVANVWYYDVALGGIWAETNSLAGLSSANEMKAVAFSPKFSSDKVMVAVGETDGASVKSETFSFSIKKWNASAEFSSHPVTIVEDGGITGLTSASVSLAPDYSGSEADKRNAFIGLAVDGNNAAQAKSGIYRVKDYSPKGLQTGHNIRSVDHNGSRLVAGAYTSTAVYRSANPMATTPSIGTITSLEKPGGVNEVVVAWAGGRVLAGTSGDNSAFAEFRDNGETFNDISLIDTVITNARDVAVSSDGDKIYLVTDDDATLSLWRKTSSWARVLSVTGTIGSGYIVRIAPEDPNAVYVARKGSITIYYSSDGGATKWFSRVCEVSVQDLAVESAKVVYALNSAGKVSKSTNASQSWATTQSTGLDNGATIVSVSTNTLLVGSQNGYVAYSTDGNAS